VTEKDINEGDQRNLRLKVSARPTDRLSIGLSAWNSRTRYDAPQVGDNRNRTPAVRSEPNQAELDMYALKVDHEFPAFSLSSMSSYVDYNSSAILSSLFDFFGGPTFDTYLRSEVFSQEVVLNSPEESPWRWSGGVFYRNAEDVTDQYLGSRLDYFSDFSEQIAVFGEVGRRFWNDKWEWTLGLRYFHDEAATRSNDNTIPAQANVPLFERIGDSFDALTPRAVLKWHPRSDLMVYATYGQGFRSGAAQTPLALNLVPQFPPVTSDKLHNYEVGAKGDFLGGRVSLETAFYYIDWQDTQQTVFAPVPNAPGVSAVVLVNASSASGRGMDVALTLRPLKGLELGAAYSTNDLTFDKEVCCILGSPVFSKGDRLGGSPKYTVNPFAAYSFPFGASGYRGQLSADASYISPANTKKLGDPNGVDGESVTIARAGFSLEAPQHWSVSVNVDNLTDYQKSASTFVSNAAIQFLSYRERPRTVNLQFEYRFD
jgi:outer membrane receptor protein involved in Fe transport